MGADENVYTAAAQAGLQLGTLRGGGAVGEQRNGHFPALQQPTTNVVDFQTADEVGEVGVVLLGQYLGRCHERGLVTAFDAGQHRSESHEGLTGADITLQQAVHRVRPGEVGADLGYGVALRGGQGKGQPGEEAVHEVPTGRVADAPGVALGGPFAHHQHELEA
jgi:hypothetical protein